MNVFFLNSIGFILQRILAFFFEILRRNVFLSMYSVQCILPLSYADVIILTEGILPHYSDPLGILPFLYPLSLSYTMGPLFSHMLRAKNILEVMLFLFFFVRWSLASSMRVMLRLWESRSGTVWH